jgi:hypothetical protein
LASAAKKRKKSILVTFHFQALFEKLSITICSIKKSKTFFTGFFSSAKNSRFITRAGVFFALENK